MKWKRRTEVVSEMAPDDCGSDHTVMINPVFLEEQRQLQVKRQRTLAGAGSRTAPSSLLLWDAGWLLLAPSILDAALPFLQPYPSPIYGKFRFLADLDTPVTEALPATMAALSALLFLLVAVALPLWRLRLLSRQRAGLARKPVFQVHGMLYGGFSQAFWFWEFVLWTRNILLRLLAIAFVHFSLALTTHAVLVVYSVLQMAYKPHSSKALYTTETLIVLLQAGYTLLCCSHGYMQGKGAFQDSLEAVLYYFVTAALNAVTGMLCIWWLIAWSSRLLPFTKQSGH